MIRRFSSCLSMSTVYRLFSRGVGGDSCRAYLTDYVKPAPNDKVLDLGCGPADILDYLPNVRYTGVDISPEYIRSARRRFAAKGRFICDDASMVTIKDEQGTFDLVFAIGVLHHLDDSQAVKLFDFAHLALRPHGRLITFDGCYVPGQSRVAQWLLRQDRGKFVRARPEYERLASNCFASVVSQVRNDLLRIPYTHLIMCCST